MRKKNLLTQGTSDMKKRALNGRISGRKQKLLQKQTVILASIMCKLRKNFNLEDDTENTIFMKEKAMNLDIITLVLNLGIEC